jgi:hypothetical protein
MNEIRSYASLSGNLLARKGAAKPAMRSHTLAPRPVLDDLGWNDMGPEEELPVEHVPSPITALTPAPKHHVAREEPEPVQLQRALAEHFPAHEPEPETAPELEHEPVAQASPEPVSAPAEALATIAMAPARRTAASAGRKAAFTLRLEADRHLRLRLASALTGKSSQQLVTAALDSFLDTIPDVARLAQHLPATAGKHD